MENLEKYLLQEDYNKDWDLSQYPIKPSTYESQRLTNIAVEYSKQIIDELTVCKSCYNSGVGILDNGIDTPKLFVCGCEAGDNIFH